MWNKVSFLKSYLPCTRAKNRFPITFTIYILHISSFLARSIIPKTSSFHLVGVEHIYFYFFFFFFLLLLLSLSCSLRAGITLSTRPQCRYMYRLRAFQSVYYTCFVNVVFHMELKSLYLAFWKWSWKKKKKKKEKIKTYVWNHKFSYIYICSTVQLRFQSPIAY